MSILARHSGTIPPPPRTAFKPVAEVPLSAEQQGLLDAVAAGRDVVVDACLGSGKTTSIQALCAREGATRNVLYLTYSKLLKADAQRRVGRAKVQNYHGIVYPSLLAAGIRCGVGESVREFNAAFEDRLAATFPVYDLLVVDEYQDINEEYAQLLRHIKSLNPAMQVVMVGDRAQKVKSDTNLDVQAFVSELCVDPVHVPFTQSFRAGPELGSLLAAAWNKPIVGVNARQTVREMSFDEAVAFIASKEPGDLLCLGQRNGAMSKALNEVERTRPERFNKNTVYASIRDADVAGSYDDSTAVFTTFDSSKGLERPVSVIFDYDEHAWQVRNSFPNADPVVLRNVFLVAASRGKDEVVFVRGPKAQRSAAKSIGFIPVRRFTHLPKVKPPVYSQPLWASDAFDFKYAENIESCFDRLEATRLDAGDGEVIAIERSDGHIDLSPVVGHYQEALFFGGYDARQEVEKNPKPLAEILAGELTDDAWRNSLLLTAVDTEQLRYAEQVTAVIPAAARDAVVARLATLLPRTARAQEHLALEGRALTSDGSGSTAIAFSGVVDAIHDRTVFELKFVTELSRAMFLQLGLYLVMSGLERGVLWNTRTDERWEVRVPDRQAFMDAVVLCVTKQHFAEFEPSRGSLA